MAVDELITLIELRSKLKREITDKEIQAVKPISTDPKYCYIDILNNEMPVKRYTSNIYDFNDNVEFYCKHFIKKIKEKRL